MKRLLPLLLCMFFCGCATIQHTAQNPKDLCEIFLDNPDWYEAALKAEARWQVKMPILMSIMCQESGFRADARPPRTRCLWIFPGPRPSSSYGYAQATNSAWEDYIRHTGRRGADRDDFEDAIDFIGWYCHMSSVRCGISKSDPYRLYLAYHEGHGGYNNGTYRGKKWLLDAARQVEQRANLYERQLKKCPLKRERFRSCIWPF
jgi:hypothetical protein